jgi:hypothetical protein
VLTEQDQIVLARLQPKVMGASLNVLFLLRFPQNKKQKTFLVDEASATWRGLCELLFALAHLTLTLEGEPGSEASWLVSRLSPLLAWLDASPNSLQGRKRKNKREEASVHEEASLSQKPLERCIVVPCAILSIETGSSVAPLINTSPTF